MIFWFRSSIAALAIAAIPAGGSARAVRAPDLPAPTPCTTNNATSFLGIAAQGSVAGAHDSAVLGGAGNVTCDQNSGIGTGSDNAIGGGDGPSFIGGGVDNGIVAGYAFVGAGFNNTAGADGSFVGAGFYNLAAGPGSYVGGGDYTYASVSSFGATRDGNLAAATDSFIGAGDQNSVAAAAFNSSVAGGTQNAAQAPEGFIGGGQSNTIENTGAADSGEYGFIGGGYENRIDPSISRGGKYAVVTGGILNTAFGIAATIGGGADNKASGKDATVPGGFGNTASGYASFAAGADARALDDGSFAWSDETTTSVVHSTAVNQFLARASGGFFLFSNAADSAGVKLAPGSGAWSQLSDRTLKTDVRALDDAQVLEKVSTLPISEWRYTSERGVRHVGPMAQDFYAAFRVGEDDRHITSIDEDGVALSAIKALHAENHALRTRLAETDHRLAVIEREMRALIEAGRR
jgi:hypothetical protein